MKTSALIGPALDWAVAKCEGYNPFVVDKMPPITHQIMVP